jgi:hypothetical protein
VVDQVMHLPALKPHGGMQFAYDGEQHVFKASSKEVGATMGKMAKDYNKGYGSIERGPGTKKKDKVARTQVELTDEEKEQFQGIMWCGTIFAWDKDGDGNINMQNEEEYIPMSEVADGEDEAAADENADSTDAGSLAKRVLKAHIFNPKKANWKKLQEEQNITFALDKQQVRIVIRYEPKFNIVLFTLAGLLTQISVMDDFQKALLHGGVLNKLSQKWKNNAKCGYGLNILAEASAQERAEYDTQVAQEITTQNAINLDLLLKARQIDANLETIKQQIAQNMETIQERRVKIKRNLELAKQIDKSLNTLDTKATKVKEIAWWLKMKWYFICACTFTLILTAIVVVLYLYLKK